MSRRGVTQELIDETRAATENQMLQDLTEIAARGGDLEYPDKQGASPLHIGTTHNFFCISVQSKPPQFFNFNKNSCCQWLYESRRVFTGKPCER